MIKVDQTRSRQSLRVIRDEVERLVSYNMSNSVLLDDQSFLQDNYLSEGEIDNPKEEDHLLGESFNQSYSADSHYYLTKPESMIITPLPFKGGKSVIKPPRTQASRKYKPEGGGVGRTQDDTREDNIGQSEPGPSNRKLSKTQATTSTNHEELQSTIRQTEPQQSTIRQNEAGPSNSHQYDTRQQAVAKNHKETGMK